MPPPLLKEIEQTKKRDRRSLSYEFKLEVLKMVESGVQRSVICKQFGLADSTVRHIIKVADKIKYHFAQTKLPKRSRYAARAMLLEEIDKALYRLIEERKANDLEVTREIICNEATRLYHELKHTFKGPKSFTPTIYWYAQFENRAKARDIHIPKKIVNYNNEESSDDEEFNEDVSMHSIDEDLPIQESCSFAGLQEIQEQNTTLEPKKLTEQVIEDALNHIETAFAILQKHDDNWERVSSLRRHINVAVSQYKELLIMSRDKPKQNAIYDLLKNVTRKPEVNDGHLED